MIALGVVQAVLLYGLGATVLDMHVRDVPAVALVAITYTIAAVMLGTALAAVLASVQQLNAFGFLGATLLGAIGGALVPLATLPAWIQHIAPATPQYWAMRAYRDVMLDGRSGASIGLPLLVLGGFTVCFAIVAVHWLRSDSVKRAWV
jgi:ABC-2 type transport system permease protein